MLQSNLLVCRTAAKVSGGLCIEEEPLAASWIQGLIYVCDTWLYD